MRGEWIEIGEGRDTRGGGTRLSPCGESGLKLIDNIPLLIDAASLPMRGEWIEIDLRLQSGRTPLSLPMRGEWIEILSRGRNKPF